MKNSFFKSIVMLAMTFGFAMIFVQCDATENDMDSVANEAIVNARTNNAVVDPCNCIIDNYQMQPLSDVEKEALTFMLEEEKLARDVYNKMNEMWNIQVFANIMASEQSHMDAIECLMIRYQLELPDFNDNPGMFTNPNLADAYAALIQKGQTSLVDALTVGAYIEDLVINDLKLNYDRVDNDDIHAVFDNLERGSRNHLRAFVRNLEKNNATYTPEFIDQDYFEYIIGTEREKGDGVCFNNTNNGPRNGNGDGTCTNDGPRNGNGTGDGTCPNDGPNSPNNGPNNGPNRQGRNGG
ncbi:MAG: DUF2202 domain-containing protein [Saprospiraceae bacterium]|nr:DUF2202 domain-containing protein [Saprospiraceae bacterium]